MPKPAILLAAFASIIIGGSLIKSKLGDGQAAAFTALVLFAGAFVVVVRKT